MNEIQIFERAEFGQIRTTTIDDEPWFVAADVCRALELNNVSRAVDRLDDDEKMTLTSSEGHSGQRGGAQSMNMVNEPGLYTLVLGSRKPEAKAFKRWITHEVLPAIRRTGAYATNARLLEAAQLLANCKQPSAIPALVSVLSEYTGIVIESAEPAWGNRQFENLVHVRNWIENMGITIDDMLAEPRDLLYRQFIEWIGFHGLNVRISMKSFCAIVRDIYGFQHKPRQTGNGERYFCK